MQYRRLGASGLVVSESGLGCNNFGRRIDLEATRTVVDAAIDAGVTLFDTADAYGESETFLGEVLQGRRDDVVIATKFGLDLGGDLGPDWGARGGRRYIRKAVERSLRRLRTDWIDLYQFHRPDPGTPLEETLSALNELVAEGTVRYIGSLEPERLAGRGRRLDGAAGRPGPVRQRPERVQPARPVGRDRAAARLRAVRRRRAAVLPAGQRDAHRQVPPRPAA